MTLDLNEDLVAGAQGVGGAFVGEVEAVQVASGGVAVVEHGLIGEGNREDVGDDKGGPARAQPAGDVKRQDQPNDMVGAVNARQVDRGTVGRRQLEVVSPEVILAVDVAHGEL